jgi:hypothetical protein
VSAAVAGVEENAFHVQKKPHRKSSFELTLELGVSSAGLKKKREKEESIGVSVPGSDLRLAAATA